MRPAPLDRVADPATVAFAWNLPNALTLLRVLCVPVLAAYLFMGQGFGARLAAAAIFVIASVTDLLDGAIARKRGQITTFGKIADPIADKALTGTALIGLSWLGELPWWVTILILGREVWVTGLRFWVIEHGVIPASRGGKAKTVAQTVAITLYLLAIPLTVFDWLSVAAMAIALALTVVTGVDYAVRARRLRRLPHGAATAIGTHR